MTSWSLCRHEESTLKQTRGPHGTPEMDDHGTQSTHTEGGHTCAHRGCRRGRHRNQGRATSRCTADLSWSRLYQWMLLQGMQNFDVLSVFSRAQEW